MKGNIKIDGQLPEQDMDRFFLMDFRLDPYQNSNPYRGQWAVNKS
jgi:hypothetical protein